MDNFLTLDDFMDIIRSLSQSQGFYGRLLRDINEMDNDQLQELDKIITERKFRDAVDVVMWIEC